MKTFVQDVTHKEFVIELVLVMLALVAVICGVVYFCAPFLSVCHSTRNREDNRDDRREALLLAQNTLPHEQIDMMLNLNRGR